MESGSVGRAGAVAVAVLRHLPLGPVPSLVPAGGVGVVAGDTADASGGLSSP